MLIHRLNLRQGEERRRTRHGLDVWRKRNFVVFQCGDKVTTLALQFCQPAGHLVKVDVLREAFRQTGG